MSPRIRAPELRGRGWLNTGGEVLTLAQLRGKVVLLDFWTFCCINCLHVLDELRPMEEKYDDVLVTVGVHSPKFVHEADPAALAAAVERYDVRHPVLDDPDLVTWQQYAVRAWPTLVVVDPEGYIAAQLSGEGHAHSLDMLIGDLVSSHTEKGTLHRGSGPYVPPPTGQSELRFPGKALLLPGGGILVSDSGNHSLVELDRDGQTVRRRIGSGQRGLADGDSRTARFAEPQGLCRLPDDVRRRVGYDVLVADTANHCLRSVRLSDGRVSTVAGTGSQWMQGDGTDQLSSPWDLAWDERRRQVLVAMAGIHQVWGFDPVSGRLQVFAGTTNEGLLDGSLAEAWFAQTSGIVVDGAVVWLVDAETSSLRQIVADRVETVVGTGLFDFGHVDGPASKALLQHPLGLAVLPDGSVAVADTYNGAVRRYDPAAEEVTTLADGLAEPTDVVVVGQHLLVIESAAHRLVHIPLAVQVRRLDGLAHRTQRPVLEVETSGVDLEVLFRPPRGQKLDERDGPATRLVVTATPPQLLRAGEGRGTGLSRRLEFDAHVGDGVLHVAAMAVSCDDDAAVEFPACHVHQQDWGVPVRLVPGGAARVELPLRAVGGS